MFPAEVVQEAIPFDAEPRLEGTWWIIEACMDHFAIAGRGFATERVVVLYHHDASTRMRKTFRYGKAYDTGPDDDDIGFFHALNADLRWWSG